MIARLRRVLKEYPFTVSCLVIGLLVTLAVVSIVSCAEPEPQQENSNQPAPTPVAQPLRCYDKDVNVVVYVDNYGGGIALLSLSPTAKTTGIPACNFAGK